MFVIDLVRRLPDIRQVNELGGYYTLHHFDINITENDDGLSCVQPDASVTISPILLLGTDDLGASRINDDGEWLKAHAEDMVNTLKSHMKFPVNFQNKEVLIRVAEQDSFDYGDDEDVMPVQRVLWEILERLDLWEPTVRPSLVNVVQTSQLHIPQSVDQHDEMEKAVEIDRQSAQKQKPMLLIVSCRAPVYSAHANELSPMISHFIQQGVGGSEKDAGNITHLRPGSFKALKKKLEAHPYGYFDAIHLDILVVHKRPTKSDSESLLRVYFQFVDQNKSAPGTIETNLKRVSQVATLLVSHGIRRAIIAPCPLARSATEAVAKVLLRGGLSTVIAMAYPVSENTIEMFITSLYIGYMQHNIPLEAAAQIARQRLRESDEQETMTVRDFVPLIYINPGLAKTPVIHPNVSYDCPLQEKRCHNSISLLRGRERDVLHIESILLLGAPLPLLIYGLSGIGKTALLGHLSAWWKASGMIDDAILVKLSSCEPFSKGDTMQQLQSHFLQSHECKGPDDLYNHFQHHRCLIMFDNLDSALLGRQQGQFITLISKLAKSGAFVVIASRRRERWLSKVKLYKLAGLPTRPATLSIMEHASSSGLTEIGTPLSPEKRAAYKTEKERSCLCGIVEIVDGNPQAINTLVSSGLYWSLAPKNVYLFMFWTSLKRQNSLTGRVKGPDKKDEPEEPRSIAGMARVYETLLSGDLCEGFPLMLLAPFIGTFPSKDLPSLLCIWGTRIRRLLGNDASTRLVHNAIDAHNSRLNDCKTSDDRISSIGDLFQGAQTTLAESPLTSHAKQIELCNPGDLFDEDHGPFQETSGLGSVLTAMCERAKEELVSAGMLEDSPEGFSPLDATERRMMRLNPLIHILFKKLPLYSRDLFSIKSTVAEAFVIYYCNRGARWPWKDFSDVRYAWRATSTEIEIEFDNFASACLTGLMELNLETTGLMALLRIAAVLERGEGDTKFYYRQYILFQVWTAALGRAMREMGRLRDADPDNKSSIFMFALAALYFAGELGRYHELNREPESELDQEAKYRPVIFNLAMSAMVLMPESVKEAANAKGLSPRQRFKALASMARDNDDFRYSIRSHIIDDIFQDIANPFDITSPQVSETTETASIEADVITMLSFSAEVGQQIRLSDAAVEAEEKKDWTETDTLLDKLLALEINSKESGYRSRIEAIRQKKRIAEQQMNNDKASQLAEELAELERIVVEEEANDTEDTDETEEEDGET
uniref:NACHT domain-containing protein n=1 Tax=Gibberella zeae TaxID=5518 RepID=A0A4E9EPL4_GIBZA